MKGAAAAAAAAAADIPLYVKGLITRPERASNLIERVDGFKKMPVRKQAEDLIPLYLDLEAYIIENEPIRKYTEETLRLDVYARLNLKDSSGVSFVGFFTPGVEGMVLLARELFSKWADTAFEALGQKRVGEIILSTLRDTAFEGVEYEDGVLDFSLIKSRLEDSVPNEDEFKKVFGEVSDNLVRPVQELRGVTPDVYLLRKKILDGWHLLEQNKQSYLQEQKSVIPITPQAREMIASAGLGDIITRGDITGLETELVAKGGERKPVSVTASALKDEAGNIQGIVIAAKDLSEIQRLEAEKVRILEHAKDDAEAEVAQRTDELKKAKSELEKSLITEKASTQQLKASEQQQLAANQQLVAAQKNLQDKLLELERFNKVAVGRELKMVELKEENARLRRISEATATPAKDEVQSEATKPIEFLNSSESSKPTELPKFTEHPKPTA
jgi:hypothetical protein